MTDTLAHRHTRMGWRLLAAFATLGMLLEALHALKLDAYLAPGNETRRLLWTLAHAHGTLIGLVHLGFATLVRQTPGWVPQRRDLASRCLTMAGRLMPLGFLLGGIRPYGGDPGFGIILAPIGGLAFVIGLALAVGGTAHLDGSDRQCERGDVNSSLPAENQKILPR